MSLYQRWRNTSKLSIKLEKVIAKTDFVNYVNREQQSNVVNWGITSRLLLINVIC